MKVTLAPLGKDDHSRVARIKVAPEQEIFSGTVSEAFKEDRSRFDLHMIEADGIPVGIFKIDRVYRQSIPISTPGSIGLRAFMIARNRQGQGIATAAVRVLAGYLAQHYPDAPAVELTVNHANSAAIACYLNGGFTDTGQDWDKGQAGPQDLLRMELR